MPSEDIERVRAAYEAWNRGDLDAALRDVHPEIEFIQDRRIPGAVEVVGPSALRGVLESFFETWEEFHVVPERIEASGEHILVVARVSARGRSSAVDVEERVGHVLTVRDGQITRWTSYVAVSDAVAAVGLSD